MDVLKRVKSRYGVVSLSSSFSQCYCVCVCVCYSELEECLLVMPFSDVTDFLKLLDIWIQVGVDWKLSWNKVTRLSLSLSLCTEWLGD